MTAIKFYNIILLLISLLIVCGCVDETKQEGHTARGILAHDYADIETIAVRLEDKIWEQEHRYFEMNLSEMPIKTNSGYCLASVDYSDQKEAYWDPIKHLEYTMAYIKKHRGENILENPEVYETITGLLDYWISNNFHNDNNWYYNRIAVPYDLADIAIMTRKWLDEDRKKKISEILNNGTIGRGVAITSNSNGTDYVNISIAHAIYNADFDLLRSCNEQIKDMITISGDKYTGIQEDYSYFDYSVLCSGGTYSATYTKNMAWFIYLLNGTRYEIPEDKERLFVDFVLDGQYFFNCNDGIPQWSMARVTYLAKGGERIRDALQYLKEIELRYRKNEIINYYHSFADNSVLSPKIQYFPIPRVIVYKGPDGYLAARGYTSEISMTDVQLKEGILNYNYSYGSNTSFMKTGNEYSTLNTVFDFSMCPGTTTYYETDDELYARYTKNYNRTWGHNSFFTPVQSDCSGLADTELNAGVMATEIRHDDIEGKNAFIIYKGHLYCLGTSFKNSGEHSKNIITTVDQSLSDGGATNMDVYYGESLYHGGFCYSNLTRDTVMHVRNSVQSGTMSRVSLNSTDAEERLFDVFKCYFDWGNRINDIKFAYSVVSIENTEMIEVEEIINTDDLQLIRFTDGIVIGFAYHKCNIDDKIIEPGAIIMKSEI